MFSQSREFAALLGQQQATKTTFNCLIYQSPS
jgi:hypothetical protein